MRIIKDLDRSIEGLDIVVVEDIVDTGLTLQFIANNLKQRLPPIDQDRYASGQARETAYRYRGGLPGFYYSGLFCGWLWFGS